MITRFFKLFAFIFLGFTVSAQALGTPVNLFWVLLRGCAWNPLWMTQRQLSAETDPDDGFTPDPRAVKETTRKMSSADRLLFFLLSSQGRDKVDNTKKTNVHCEPAPSDFEEDGDGGE